MEQWRLATLSFQLWGAMTPIKEQTPPTAEEIKKNDPEPEKAATDQPPTPKRSIGQAEIESAYYKVSVEDLWGGLLSDGQISFHPISMTAHSTIISKCWCRWAMWFYSHLHFH